MSTGLLRINKLRCEYLENPIGIDIQNPRLSWQLEADEPNSAQLAYRIRVSKAAEDLADERHLMWDTGRVESSETVHIKYNGKPLENETRYFWNVEVWNQDNGSSQSEVAFWQTGLGSTSSWTARWIGFHTEVDQSVQPEGTAGAESPVFPGALEPLRMPASPYLRREFALGQEPTRALLYVTARGLYDISINGASVTDARLTPGWTDYHQELEYQTYDVTSLLQPGANVIGAILADGWYAGYLAPWGQRELYGSDVALRLQLHIHLADGTREQVLSDEQWRASEGAHRYADLYHGEYVDARRMEPNWNTPSFGDTDWNPVQIQQETTARMVGQCVQPIRVTEELSPISMREVSPGVFVYDFGQNLVGWVRLTGSAPSGTQVRLRFSETIYEDGSVDTTNLRSARATDTYIFAGHTDEVFEPRFTYHGFQYVELTGLDHPTLSTLTGCVVHIDIPYTGSVETSSPMLNKLFENTLWSQRGNYSSVPTDCPQRNERLGWTGDMLSFAYTGALNMDCAAYYSRWMRIVSMSQTSSGAFPNVAPRVGLLIDGDGAPAWGDAGIMMPWLMWRLYGDRDAVEEHYHAMASHMDFIYRDNPSYLRKETRSLNFGDWLSYNDFTPLEVVSTALWAMSALWMEELAAAVGKSDDAARYQELHRCIASAFADAFVTSDGRIQGDTQGGYVLALAGRVIPEPLREKAVKHLVHAIERQDYHLSTGFVATPLLLPMLSEAGHDDVAFRLLLQETVPSWGYMVKQGATTIWERWDGDIEMQRIHERDTTKRTFAHPVIGELAGMNSYNHFAFGAVAEWMYRYLLGIQVDPQQPGYQHVIIEPHPGAGLSFARGYYDSVRGRIEVAWKLIGDQASFEVRVPANMKATVRLPSSAPADDALRLGGTAENGHVVWQVGSGIYQLNTTW